MVPVSHVDTFCKPESCDSGRTVICLHAQEVFLDVIKAITCRLFLKLSYTCGRLMLLCYLDLPCNGQETLHLMFVDPEARFFPNQGVHGHAINPCDNRTTCKSTSTSEVSGAP